MDTRRRERNIKIVEDEHFTAVLGWSARVALNADTSALRKATLQSFKVERRNSFHLSHSFARGCLRSDPMIWRNSVLILKKSSVLTCSEAVSSEKIKIWKFKMEINLKVGQQLEVQDGFLNPFGKSPQKTWSRKVIGWTFCVLHSQLANQILSLPVETVGNSAKLPVRASLRFSTKASQELWKAF